MNKKGRKSIYTSAIAEEICERLADGESLRSICKSEAMPAEATVRGWARDNVDGFSDLYAFAREMGFDAIAEDLLALVDAPLKSDDPTIKPADIIANRRLQVDMKLRLLSKWSPNRYGDRPLDADKTQPIKVIVNTHPGPASVANADMPVEQVKA